MFDQESGAQRLLAGIEGGRLSTADAIVLAEDLDPVLFYVIVSYLREIYPASDPTATSVLERVVQLTAGSSVLVRHHKDGERDSVSRWLEAEYTYGEFRHRGAELVKLVADKLET